MSRLRKETANCFISIHVYKMETEALSVYRCYSNDSSPGERWITVIKVSNIGGSLISDIHCITGNLPEMNLVNKQACCKISE